MVVTVIGSGIVGLTSAVRLQEAGFSVQLLTRDLPSETTSAVAAAVWYPYQAYPKDLVTAWGARTLAVCHDLAQNPDTGISLLPVVELFDHGRDDPWWKTAVPTFRRATPNDLLLGYVDGYTFEAALLEAPAHLDYLQRRFTAQGGQMTVVPDGLPSLKVLYQPHHLLVNCTGLGARTLVDDAEVYPIRGQVVRVSNPGLTRCLIEDYGPLAMTYIIPRRHDCILGGTAEPHVWSLEPDPETTREILRKSRLLEPLLHQAEVLEVKVGLRPARPTVRLALEYVGPTSAILHNYGHGGSGFTLAWGCADDVVAQTRIFFEQIEGL